MEMGTEPLASIHKSCTVRRAFLGLDLWFMVMFHLTLRKYGHLVSGPPSHGKFDIIVNYMLIPNGMHHLWMICVDNYMPGGETTTRIPVSPVQWVIIRFSVCLRESDISPFVQVQSIRAEKMLFIFVWVGLRSSATLRVSWHGPALHF